MHKAQMSSVLIVNKGRQDNRVFLGGVNLDKKTHVHLCPGYIGYTHSPDIKIDIGDVWDLELGRLPEMNTDPPHTENWNIMSKGSRTKTVPLTEIRCLILNHLDAPRVKPSALFDGLVEFNENGKGYIDTHGSIPSYSIGFWRFDHPLYLDYDNNENEDGNYYSSKSGNFRVKYHGDANPRNKLDPDTILRFFLTQPREFMGKDVHWVQLSGFFI